MVVVFIRYGNDQQVKILKVCKGKWGQKGDDRTVLSTRSPPTSPTESCSPELEPCATMFPRLPSQSRESLLSPHSQSMVFGTSRQISLWLFSSPAQIWPSIHDVYCYCMQSTQNIRFALKPTGLPLCWWGNAAPPLCAPKMLSKDENTVGNAPRFLVMAGAPSPMPCLLHSWRSGSVCNYPPGIADVLRVVLHRDGQPVLCHPLPVQGAVYVDDAGLPRKKEEIGTRGMRWASRAVQGILWNA